MQDNGLMDGWIKLYRKSIDSQVFQSEGLWKVWTWCIMKANHKDTWVPVKTGKGETTVHVKRGQFIFGRKTASKELKMKPPTVQYRMRKLEDMQNLVSKSITHYSIVTVCNYDFYQGMESGELSPNSSPNYQPTITNKNVKNEKNLNIECNDFERLEAFLSSLPEFQSFPLEAKTLIQEFINKVREANKTRVIQGGRISGLVDQFRGIQDKTDPESLLVGLKKTFRKMEKDGFDFKKRDPTGYVWSVAKYHKVEKERENLLAHTIQERKSLQETAEGEIFQGLRSLVE